jgi:hypothetical protein
MTRYWFDTEFIEGGKTIDLVSIGIVAEDGREYYTQRVDACFGNASDWVARNVLMNLEHYDMVKHARACKRREDSGATIIFPLGQRCMPSCLWRSTHEIAAEIRAFCEPDKHGKPEFWGYYADYDWVVLCQLFGAMMDLPKGWPMYCRDIKQECDRLGNPKLPDQGKDEHHALADARWNWQAWQFLQEYTP